MFAKVFKISCRNLSRCSFEIHGQVQGVLFRKHTEAQSKRLGLRGWVRNTEEGTVVGELEGNEASLRQMQLWLKAVGSPKSRIESAEFGQMRTVSGHKYNDFVIKL